MNVSIVLTLIGPDRPGIVESLARTVADHDANWLESRMASLAGQFAGVLRVRVPEERAAALADALRELDSSGLRVQIESGPIDESAERPQTLRLELVGNDRPGIVRDVSKAFAQRNVNVEELTTRCNEAAPMSGGLLFRAQAWLHLPAGVSEDQLRQDLEELANDLMVDVSLQDSREPV